MDNDLNALKSINADIDDYYMHIAMKSDDNQEWDIHLATSSSAEITWHVKGAGATGNNVVALPRDGQWHEFNLNLGDAGAVFGKYSGGSNFIIFQAINEVQGNVLYYDGIYIKR